MSKSVLLIMILSFLFALSVLATEQEPDDIFFSDQLMTLQTGWGHPSPLQTYYSQNKISYPFSSNSTGNYRGHVAVWEITNDSLFLKAIKVDAKVHKPSEYSVKSKAYKSEEKVFADWFSGVIECWETEKENRWKPVKWHYFYVKAGQVAHYAKLVESDFKRITAMKENDTSNHELMEKYTMLFYQRKYISYYFRLGGDDKIIYNGNEAKFAFNTDGSPLLGMYNYDHFNWPYGWTRNDSSGAPHCTWTAKDSKLYLKDIYLLLNTNFEKADSIQISLLKLFKDKISDNLVLADWVSGVFIVKIGKEEPDKYLPGQTVFKPTELTFLRIDKGVIAEIHTIPANFNFRKMPDDTDPKLKKIIEDFMN